MIDMQQGRIIKIISNQYTIQNEKEEIIAKPRGKMRQQQAPVVGDFVEYEKIEIHIESIRSFHVQTAY